MGVSHFASLTGYYTNKGLCGIYFRIFDLTLVYSRAAARIRWNLHLEPISRLTSPNIYGFGNARNVVIQRNPRKRPRFTQFRALALAVPVIATLQ
jgi:hypothetical protein